jgi:SulP family sulfate permease
MVAAGLAIIYLLPLVTKAVPSPLVVHPRADRRRALVRLDLRTVGDMGDLPDTLPIFLIPDIPLTLETLQIILPYSAAVAAVGLLESLMTASIVDELTDTTERPQPGMHRPGRGQHRDRLHRRHGGLRHDRPVDHQREVGRARAAVDLHAGRLLLFLIVVLGDWVRQIPMPALVAIMIMVSIGTFSWSSIKARCASIRAVPRS